ncbi:MAG: hypothetical protein A2252_03835 [Elusimicrobia bacterium RIFOXYA2_FULL_39_19]|nr:MAG: hypothetical protein A2252_03835 [Elusimicrobia bacterium RIFOXYA2_FULL_39_19]
MIKEILMPRLSENMQEGILSAWLKKEGEKIKEGEPLFEILTDKAAFEVESPLTGTIEKIIVQASPDKNIPVGFILAYINTGKVDK